MNSTQDNHILKITKKAKKNLSYWAKVVLILVLLLLLVMIFFIYFFDSTKIISLYDLKKKIDIIEIYEETINKINISELGSKKNQSK